MPSDRQIRLSGLAESDLREILQFTAENWGTAQRDSYASLLNGVLERLCDFPLLGVKRIDLQRDLRSFPAGEHVIICSFTDSDLDVTRIMHARRSLEDK